MTKKKKKIILTSLFSTLFLLLGLFFFLYKQIYDPENLKAYCTKELKKIFKDPVPTPESIDVSLMNDTIVIKNFVIPDTEGKTLLKVPELLVRFEKRIWGLSVRICSLEVTQPSLFVRQDMQGKWNFNVFRETQGEKRPFSEVLQEISDLCHANAIIQVKDGKVSLEIANGLTRPLNVKDIGLEIKKEKVPKLSGTKKERFSLKLHCAPDILSKIGITGSYDFENGLDLRSETPFSADIQELLKLQSFLNEDIRYQGQITVEEITVQGMSRQNPAVVWQARLAQKQGFIWWKKACVQISEISGDIREGKLCGISARIKLQENTFEIQNGRMTQDGQIYLPMELKSLSLDLTLLEFLENLTETPLRPYWEMFSPKGTIRAKCLLTKSKDKPWNWDATLSLMDGEAQYKGLSVKQMRLDAHFMPGCAEIKQFEWKIRDSLFSLSPAIKIAYPGETKIVVNPGIDLTLPISISPFTLSFQSLQVDRAFWETIPEMMDVWKLFQPVGFVDGKVIWSGSEAKSLPRAEVRCYRMNANFNELPYPAYVHSATFTFQDGCLTIENIQAGSTTCDAKVRVWGKVLPLIQPSNKIPVDVYFQVHNITLDRTAYETFSLEPDPNSWLKDLQSIWDSLRIPQGAVISIDGHVSRTEDTIYPMCFDITLESNNASASYIDFPYGVTDIRGKFTAKRNKRTTYIRWEGVHAKKQNATFQISGELKAIKGKLTVKDLIVNGWNVPLDNDLKKVLGQEYEEIWDQLSPKGRMNIGVKVNKKADEKQIQWKADVHLKDLSASYRDFPYPVHNLEGKLSLEPNHFVLHKIESVHKNARFSIQGEVKGKEISLDITGSDVPLDKKLYNAIPAEAREIWDQFEVRGEADANIRLHKEKDEERLQWQAVASFRKLKGLYKLFPYFVENIQGKVRFKPRECEIMECHISDGDLNADITGYVHSDALKIEVLAQKLSLDQKLYKALLPEFQKFWDSFKPAGRANVRFTMEKKDMDKKTYLHILPEDMSICYEGFPYRISGLKSDSSKKNGGIHIRDNGVEFNHLLGKNGASHWKLHGSFYRFSSTTEDSVHSANLSDEINKIQKNVEIVGKQANVEKQAKAGRQNGSGDPTEKIKEEGALSQLLRLRIEGKPVILDQELRTAIANQFPRLIENFSPQGRAEEVVLDIFQYKKKEKQNEFLRYDARITGLSASMKEDSLLQKTSGDIVMEGYAYNDKYHTTGSLENGTVVFRGLEAKNVSSRIKFFDDYLLFQPISGSFYDGELKGTLLLDTSPYGAYQGSFLVENAQIARIAQMFETPKSEKNASDKSKSEKSPMSGILNGEISFQGNLIHSNTLTGQGEMHLRNGAIWQLPIFLALLDIFSLPSKPAFREGNIQFTISKGMIVIESMNFYSSLLAMSGRGNIDFDGNLKLVLLTDFSMDILPRIPFVDKMFDSLQEDIFALDVKGTLQNPTISLKQWGDLRNFFHSVKPSTK